MCDGPALLAARMRREASKYTGMGAAKLYSTALACLGKSKLADAYLLFGVAAAALCTYPLGFPWVRVRVRVGISTGRVRV